MKDRFDLIVFDWDGTLMDSERKIVRCFEMACRDVNVVYPGDAAVRAIIGLGLREAVDRLLPGEDDAIIDQVTEAYRDHFLVHDKTEMEFFPGVLDGLKQLEGHGYMLAVATGKARRGLKKLLDEWQLHDQFVATRCADEAFSKPHPKMLEDILGQTGVASNRAIMIGDTTFDMEMANNARVAGLAVSYGVHDRDSLLKHDPVDCLDSFEEVRAWLM
ncbi:MAG: HAD-IIIA family hydrolase [Gammaproteobacteria bacterium]|nr:HAD-IIIA family hydrolase [Gammaproteobacteria bacterium]